MQGTTQTHFEVLYRMPGDLCKTCLHGTFTARDLAKKAAVMHQEKSPVYRKAQYTIRKVTTEDEWLLSRELESLDVPQD